MDSGLDNKSYLVVDIENNRTKVVLFGKSNNKIGLIASESAPTTIDAPELDVTIGVKGAISKLAQNINLDLWEEEGPKRDLKILCTSSTSGGLHMVVAGLISMISVESAQRAALGAGALLMDVFSVDKRRPDFKMVDDMRSLKPDMYLLAGGTNGGNVHQVLDLAELIDEADIKPRFGFEYQLPVIYGGNVEIQDEVSKILSDEKYTIRKVDNVRPVIDVENLGPARDGIYDSYMEHVIVHSPGYDKLLNWVDHRILPTQAAIGKLIYDYAKKREINLVAVDVGGVTTDVYSVFNSVFNRSLNANIGMTYGITNIMKEAGVKNLLRWIPLKMGERKIRNIISNMMINQPESLSREEILVKQAAAIEAIRLGLDKHKEVASRLKGVTIGRTISDIFGQSLEKTYLDMLKTDVIIGKGDIFTQRSSLEEKALLFLDAFQPEGITELLVDKTNIMPHLGMLAEEDLDAAIEILRTDCLSQIGTCVAPRGKTKKGKKVMEIRVQPPNDEVLEKTLFFGDLITLPLRKEETAVLEVSPTRGFDIGGGMNKSLRTTVRGGDKGIVLDARGRPIEPNNIEEIMTWIEELGLDTRTSNDN